MTPATRFGSSEWGEYPSVLDPAAVGTYSAVAKAGGGFVWDEVLEYRVWLSPRDGAADRFDGDDYFAFFDNARAAFEFAEATAGSSEPLALVLQREYLDEPEPGVYLHCRDERVTEWPVVFLTRPRRTARTIPDFLAPDAPTNRLDVLRGLA